ncbi:MAG: family 16 glycoside hydrolase [Thermoguttaceae bacterium]
MTRSVLSASFCLFVVSAALGADGFTELFNGKDLAGWVSPPQSGWVVEDGTITLKEEFDGKEHNLDYLWTDQEYGDFVLELEFKVPEKANSGIFLRTPDMKDPVYTGLEIQVTNSFGRQQLSPVGTAGAVYDCLAPSANPVKKAGEWNRFRITCRRNLVEVELNGEAIVSMDLNRWTEPNRNPDGSPNKFPTAIKNFARSGRIGLQNHGRPVWYRNIRIQRLETNQVYTMTPEEHGQAVKAPDGRTVFSYMTRKPAETNLTANSVCCLYPVYTPGGERAVDFAPGDHRHHRGIFLAWHATQGAEPADFWGWGEFAPTENRVIQNRHIRLAETDADHALVEVKNDWKVGDRTMIVEETTIGTHDTDGVTVIDLEYRLAPQEDVTLLQTAFGGFCVKGRKEGQAYYAGPSGKINLLSPHHLKPQSDWPAAPWYDYVIALESGKTIGVAVVDHPENPPSLWHNLLPIAMVNPCIVAAGPVQLKKGVPLVLRYRVVVHDGAEPTELLNRLADEFRR